MLLSITGGLFWKINTLAQIKVFKTNKYQFDEIYFNRYIIYKNQFEFKQNVMTNHFKKYAIYYISGTARISFNPNNINYNSSTKTITINQSYFDIDLNIEKELEIDKVNAKAISDNEAQKTGMVVGLAGAYTAGKAGYKLSSLLPPHITAGVTGASTILGGAVGYFATSNALTGAKISKDISETDRKESLKVGKELILAQLKIDYELVSMYKEHFEAFIIAKYKTYNMEVNQIEYQNITKGDVK